MNTSSLGLLFLWLMLTAGGYSQSMYSVINNRVVFSTLVNNDTLLIENMNNEVRLNGELGLLEVVYHNQDARVVGSNNGIHLQSDVTIKFWNEYQWLDERIKSSEFVVDFVDEVRVDINGKEEVVVLCDYWFTRIRGGGHGFVVMIEIRGKLPPEPLSRGFPNLIFRDGLLFDILLTVQVTH